MPCFRWLALSVTFLFGSSIVGLPLRGATLFEHLPSVNPQEPAWSGDLVRHLYGLPGVANKSVGQLNLTAQGIRYQTKSSVAMIPIDRLQAISAGSERVELWGAKGRLARMVIPNGGGLLAASFLHHKVDLLTIEYRDEQGGFHAAVFSLEAGATSRVLQVSEQLPISARAPEAAPCSARSASVRVDAPHWSGWSPPAAYRALVYEHLVNDLETSHAAVQVIRDGAPLCSRYTLSFSEEEFKQGNQVERAMIGPLGMFLGKTQIALTMNLADEDGHTVWTRKVTATVKNDAESNHVAASEAKKLAKEFERWQKSTAQKNSGQK